MPKRRLRSRLLAALLAPIVFFGMVEGVLRIAGWSFDPAAELAGANQRDELAHPEIYASHPRYLWSLKPSSVIDESGAGMTFVQTNSLGFRGPELPGPKTPGEFRVLCFGDSVTFGLGLLDSDTVPSQLEYSLLEHVEEPRVVNLGVPGWSSLQGRRLLEDVAGLEPDAIVFWFGMNDAKEHLGTPDRLLRPAEASAAVDWLRELRTVQVIRAMVVRFRGSALGETRVGPEEFRENLEAFRATGVPVVVVRYPERARTTLSEMENVLEQARSANVSRLIGPRPVFSPFGPAPAGDDLTGTRVSAEDGPALRFTGPERIVSVTVATLENDKERLARQIASFEALMSCLPEGSPGYEELFGEARPEEIFTDNCHLTPTGAHLAGQALARWIADRTKAGRR